jgi:hypothetical protein
MKRFVPLLLLLTPFLPAQIHAGDAAPPAAAGTYIPDLPEVPVFTPPPPVVPNTPLPDVKVTLVQRGQASMAPDLPDPALPSEPPSEAAPLPLDTTLPQTVIITMAGTVYDHRVSVVTWQHPDTQQPYEAVVGFDIGLLTPIGHFIHQGVPHDSQLFISNQDTRESAARRAPASDPPPFRVPQIAQYAYRITQGDPTDFIGIQPLLTLRDLYLAEKPRLRQLSADIAGYQQDVQAWADSHPAPIEPPVFWFKPHRNSRYLTPQDRSDQRHQQQAAEIRAEQAQEGEIQP